MARKNFFRLPAVRFVERQEYAPGKLLRNRASPGLHILIQQLLDYCAGGPGNIDPHMLVEIVIFDRKNGIQHDLRNVAHAGELPVFLGAQLADDRIVPEVNKAGQGVVVHLLEHRFFIAYRVVLHECGYISECGAAGQKTGNNARNEKPFDRQYRVFTGRAYYCFVRSSLVLRLHVNRVPPDLEKHS